MVSSFHHWQKRTKLINSQIEKIESGFTLLFSKAGKYLLESGLSKLKIYAKKEERYFNFIGIIKLLRRSECMRRESLVQVLKIRRKRLLKSVFKSLEERRNEETAVSLERQSVLKSLVSIYKSKNKKRKTQCFQQWMRFVTSHLRSQCDEFKNTSINLGFIQKEQVIKFLLI
jgi:hypothetical protein